LSVIKQFSLLAEYNKVMNQRQYDAASKLSETDLCEDKGAFFKSVLGTLNHIIVGDIIRLKRFAKYSSGSESLSYIHELDKPDSLDSILFIEFCELRKVREKIDEIIITWIESLDEIDMGKCISYTNMAGKLFNKPFASLINHLFMHQVHHRGQVTTLLSQYGVNFGETDLIEIISDCSA